MRQLLVICGVAAFFAAPVMAANPSGASIRLDQPQPVLAGSTVTFSYTLPNVAPQPRIVLYCNHADGSASWGQGQWVADGTAFTIPVGMGIASCTAELGVFKSWAFKEIAETTFAVTS